MYKIWRPTLQIADNLYTFHLLLGFIIPPRSNSLVVEWEPINEEFPDSCRFGLGSCRFGLGSDFSEYICLVVGLPFGYGPRRSPAYFL
jgi:hypothetical protein